MDRPHPSNTPANMCCVDAPHHFTYTCKILKGELLADVRRQTPMGRVGDLKEVSGVVTFLCSKAAGYTTGQ